MTAAVPDLTCKELVELVTDYLEGSLPVDERTRLELHLAHCAGCRTFLAQMRRVVESAGELAAESRRPGERDALPGMSRDGDGSGGRT